MRDLKRSNAREKAWETLSSLGFRTFTPLRERVVRRAGHVERSEQPAVAGLLFVDSDRATLDPVVADTPTLQYRYVKGAPFGTVMTVPDDEMERFIRFAANGAVPVTYFTPGQITPAMIGREVTVIGGPLAGATGRLLKVRGLRKKRIVVQIPGLLGATADVAPDLIRLL